MPKSLIIYVLIVAILLYPLLKLILKKIMRKSSKNIEILSIVFAIIGSPIVLVGVISAYINIIKPRISLKPLNKPIDFEIVSAKQIAEYLSNEIRQIDKLTKYDLTVGKVEMHVDTEHRGEVTVTFVERENENSKVIFADLDTRKNIFYKFSDYGRESKLYPGIIPLQNWKIDSRDAVRISEDVFSASKNFRYDEIWLYSLSYSKVPKEEAWLVYLTDTNSNIHYHSRINPYSGEVLDHNISSIKK